MSATNPATISDAAADGGSFRDPDGRVFEVDGEIVRGLTAEGLADWEAFAESGLLKRLAEGGEIVETTAAEPAVLDALRSADPDGHGLPRSGTSESRSSRTRTSGRSRC